jgi:pimeloyl-ACP methyl ester carboxylesterase
VRALPAGGAHATIFGMLRTAPTRVLRARSSARPWTTGAARTGRGRPATGLLLAEAPRAALELAAAASVAPLLAVERGGDGHPVLVLPGLLGGDPSTLVLRRYLRWLGYAVSGWKLGANVGPTEAVVGGLRDRLDQMAQESGEKVTLVGWSLGGLYAHELARRAPGSTRQVVTLGSPVQQGRRRGRAASQLFDAVSSLHVAPAFVPRPWSEAGPLRVPVTAVYTRSDGVVPWRSCLVPAGKRRENVEVRGSHTGLAHNPTVLHLLADRLAQPSWRPFAPGLLVRHLYP